MAKIYEVIQSVRAYVSLNVTYRFPNENSLISNIVNFVSVFCINYATVYQFGIQMRYSNIAL